MKTQRVILAVALASAGSLYALERHTSRELTMYINGEYVGKVRGPGVVTTWLGTTPALSWADRFATEDKPATPRDEPVED